ncbi:hypothetical protein GYN24_10625 [Lactococcus piscium]|uniref:Putative exodeoxyribonuclease 8 PDDEXK-like domain-containing protein n=1 Tax=Pseudolactococcus paracarnosus TaxID=2749962 RepID=A0A7L4WD20_9LACT|nr:PD-(D/E)XK nuclease-like domain-containing protein [Lactococcus paracarnosus]MCJ1995033.1 hypothetical protein [Lactococcus paracarnosus]QDJ28238.1 hypothetical protein BHS01_06760 [Lactococcus paracarnosus]SPC35358.1 conserved hypothetical protein [Lactococcus piscium]
MAKDLLGADYYIVESSRAYWSISQYKRFRECEERAVAELAEEWTEDRDSTPLLVGNYVHSYFESPEAHEIFKFENGSTMIAKTGATKCHLKKDFKVAEVMINALKTDKQFAEYYIGEKEVSVTGVINGIDFKGKIDCLNIEGGYFVDIKTTKSQIDDLAWSDEFRTKMRWFEVYGYVLQMATYKELLYQKYGKEFIPIIYAVTKESIPDTRAVVFQSDEKLKYELAELSTIISKLDAVKKGISEAILCKHCNYCKSHGLTDKVEIY